MSDQYIVWLAIAAVIVIGLLFIKRSRSASATAPEARPAQRAEVALADDKLVQPEQLLPHAIVLGSDAEHPGVRIAPLSDAERFRKAKTLPVSSDLGTRLSAGLQAVPSLLVAEGHRGKQLMEVVIKGDLVRAADGMGMRAWAVGANNKVVEQAKLFDTNKLQGMVGAAAVWQVASVVVAQKHLADISVKLDEIRDGVQDLSHFLGEERRAKVTGIYDYLATVVSAISNGELSQPVRTELETCDRELVQVQHHLQSELERRCGQAVEHKEFAGTGDLEKESVAKYEKLTDLAKDMRLTLKARALAWHVLSLFPGEPGLKESKLESVLRSAEEIDCRLKTIDENAESDCKKFSSFWNKAETLAARKEAVQAAAQKLTENLRKGMVETKQNVQNSQALFLVHDQPTYLIFEVEDGRIGELRMMEKVPVAP